MASRKTKVTWKCGHEGSLAYDKELGDTAAGTKQYASTRFCEECCVKVEQKVETKLDRLQSAAAEALKLWQECIKRGERLIAAVGQGAPQPSDDQLEANMKELRQREDVVNRTREAFEQEVLKTTADKRQWKEK